jgi:hypothetical protein
MTAICAKCGREGMKTIEERVEQAVYNANKINDALESLCLQGILTRNFVQEYGFRAVCLRDFAYYMKETMRENTK